MYFNVNFSPWFYLILCLFYVKHYSGWDFFVVKYFELQFLYRRYNTNKVVFFYYSVFAISVDRFMLADNKHVITHLYHKLGHGIGKMREMLLVVLWEM